MYKTPTTQLGLFCERSKFDAPDLDPEHKDAFMQLRLFLSGIMPPKTPKKHTRNVDSSHALSRHSLYWYTCAHETPLLFL